LCFSLAVSYSLSTRSVCTVWPQCFALSPLSLLTQNQIWYLQYTEKCLLYLFTNSDFRSYLVCPHWQTENKINFPIGSHIRDFRLTAEMLMKLCCLLRYYVASCGNCLPTFRDNVTQSSRVKSPFPTRTLDPWGLGYVVPKRR
jgi:hypothetical protein